MQMVVARPAETFLGLPRPAAAGGRALGLEPAIDIVLVGGNPVYREGVKSLFARSRLRVVAECDRIEPPARIPAAAAGRCVVVVVSPSAESLGLPCWRSSIAQCWPGARAIVLAQPGEERLLAEALRGGAEGCLFTDMSAEAMVHAIRLVALGENIFPTRIAPCLLQTASQSGAPRLTPRERDILRGLLAGASNKTIANDLGTTDMTVKAQLRHLLRKLGVANRTQAALWAREYGLATDMTA
jgi:two-component system nitrate/nitrite response regulator NarL